MIFEALYDSARADELLLIDGGLCRYHLRRDGQLTVHEIISTRRGAGTAMLAHLTRVPHVQCIVAKCPTDLAANDWYRRRGFVLVDQQTTQRGRGLNVWRLDLT